MKLILAQSVLIFAAAPQPLVATSIYAKPELPLYLQQIEVLRFTSRNLYKQVIFCCERKK